MKNKNVFFINILPSNDRREDKAYAKHSVEYALKIKKDLFSYTLITLGHNRAEPWVLAQELMRASADFNPLIAVNPYYQHPIEIVKKIAALQSFYKNSLALNLIPGSFFKELESIHELSSFEEKQNRLQEFKNVIKHFNDNKNECSFQGDVYKLNNAKIYPSLQDQKIDFFFSGMRQGEVEGNEGAYFIQNIKPKAEMRAAPKNHVGLALGVCTRETSSIAHEALKDLYPENRQGQMLFEMAVNNDETPWNVWVKNHLKESDSSDFNLSPMKNYWSSLPFIVGSYDEVTDLLKSYCNLGYEFFVMDFHPGDFEHIEECIKRFRAK